MMPNMEKRGQSFNVDSINTSITYYSVLKFFPESMVNDLILCQKIKNSLLSTLPQEWYQLASRSIFVEEGGQVRFAHYNFVLDKFIYIWVQHTQFDTQVSQRFYSFQQNAENLKQSAQIFCQHAQQADTHIRQFQSKNYQLTYDKSCIKALLTSKDKLCDLIKDLKIDEDGNESVSTLSHDRQMKRTDVDRNYSDLNQMASHLKQKKLQKVQSKLQESMYDQIIQLQFQDEIWQTARQFVVVIYQSEIPSDLQIKKNETVRFIQPAQQFYQKVLQLWMLEQSSGIKVNFSQFSYKAQHFLGQKYNDKLLIPLHQIFQLLEQVLIEQMKQIKDPIDHSL
ncbi:hypothetical protein pb186bvf_019509 [Paramecium bursaria]